MVSGADRERLALIMSVAYALLGIAMAAPALRQIRNDPGRIAQAPPSGQRVVAAPE
jgi:hypothetical protein